MDLLECGGRDGLDRLGHPLVRRREHALHERALARLVVVRGGGQGEVLGTDDTEEEVRGEGGWEGSVERRGGEGSGDWRGGGWEWEVRGVGRGGGVRREGEGRGECTAKGRGGVGWSG